MSLYPLLLILFIAVFSIQIAYYLAFLFAFSVKPSILKAPKQIPISVIICAKNEAKNLDKNLPSILSQDYNSFEVVLVNDSSSDKTLKVMKAFETKHSNIKVVDVKQNETFWGNKKYALTLGIKASTNQYLVFTDADCIPKSNQWLTQITRNFSKEKHIVLGYGAYAKKKLSFLNKLIRFETVMTALQYFSYANLGLPYMGVGRNMAYKKDLFFNNSGFNSHTKIKSGDDDLFINEMANSRNTAICFSKESFTISEPKKTLRTWFLQKRRHVSTVKFYRPLHRYLLGIFYISQLLFLILATLLLILNFMWQWVVAIVALRFTIQLISFALTAKKLNEKDLIFLAPFLEIFLVMAQLSIFITNLISRPNHWK